MPDPPGCLLLGTLRLLISAYFVQRFQYKLGTLPIDEAFERMCVRAKIALRDVLEIFRTRN
jgi:hypothetical protein